MFGVGWCGGEDGSARRGKVRSLWIGAGLALLACGGMAEGELPGGGDDVENDRPQLTPSGGSSATRPARPSRGGSTTAAPAQEACYSPDEVEDQLEDVLRFIPEDVFDSNGCLVPEYSGWLVGEGCGAATERASFRNGQCCYVLDGVSAQCDVR